LHVARVRTIHKRRGRRAAFGLKHSVNAFTKKEKRHSRPFMSRGSRWASSSCVCVCANACANLALIPLARRACDWRRSSTWSRRASQRRQGLSPSWRSRGSQRTSEGTVRGNLHCVHCPTRALFSITNMRLLFSALHSKCRGPAVAATPCSLHSPSQRGDSLTDSLRAWCLFLVIFFLFAFGCCQVVCRGCLTPR
jgi:hypothetical protein